MVVEKSSNDGVSWSPLEFFSRNCSRINGMFENEWSAKFGNSLWKRPNCSEDTASWDAISTGRDLTVHLADKIRAMKGWSLAQTCKTLFNGNASDSNDPEPAIKFFLANKIRIRLLRPGFKNQKTSWQSLHYGISNINFSGSDELNNRFS
ncbi:unnamed protein product [Oikopleura dioica]|uniref:Laminin N-terminal domain-containing protein n=1 Tax=Oikopleura dioica TaxID=34765 RepID=E4Y825_OIKDI|nr:unnamed protein product [Oikopleura dioica]